MRYQSTAVQIYDMPAPSDPDVRLDRRMALIVSAIGLLGLAAFGAFLVLGILSQRF